MRDRELPGQTMAEATADAAPAADAPQEQPLPGFEGVEKNLEIDFVPGSEWGARHAHGTRALGVCEAGASALRSTTAAGV